MTDYYLKNKGAVAISNYSFFHIYSIKHGDKTL
jgi:hypothetical protein